MYLGSGKFSINCNLFLPRKCCSNKLQLWLPSFYVCEDCHQTLIIVHAFREKCIASDLARKALEDKLSVNNHLNTEKYSQCKEESSRTVQLKNEIEGGTYLWKFVETSLCKNCYLYTG